MTTTEGLIVAKILLFIVCCLAVWCVYDYSWIDSKLYFWTATIVILLINFGIWLM